MKHHTLRQALIIGMLWGAFSGLSVPFALGETRSSDVEVSSRSEAFSSAPAQIALGYAEAMASENVMQWASLDLGCLTRQRDSAGSASPEPKEPRAQTISHHCWKETLAAHQDLVQDEPESGIFGAVGRGTGLGLIHESHQHADFWKDYPPALAVSPAVIPQDSHDSLPQIAVAHVHPSRPGGLIFGPQENPVEVHVIAVDLLVTYPDPMVAPLALRPGEPWWASGVIRRYGPVRMLLVRFHVVSGLQNYGYAENQAIVNEVLGDAPQLAEPRSPGILPDSPQWWDRHQAAQRFEDELEQVQRLESFPERLEKYRRLLLLDPQHPALNAALGTDLYLAFLREGITKGRIAAANEATLWRLVELYWNIQAQTWRQKFTEVATGHSRAAEAFFAAIPALEVAVQGGAGTPEMRRRLGALYRWNNDSAAALHIHQELLDAVPSTDHALRGKILSELAWDRVQWLSWNRRYDHPWLPQAREEAQQAFDLSASSLEKLYAAQASLVIEALAVPRDQQRMQTIVQVSRSLHDRIPGVDGLWPHLIGNDLVKALVSEGSQTVLPSPGRSDEVLDVAVHHTVQDPNTLLTWNFDQDEVGQAPSGFSLDTSGHAESDTWRIAADSTAPIPSHVLTQTKPCRAKGCYRIVLADTSTFNQPDIVVRLRQESPAGDGEAGIVLSASDMRNFDAVTVNPETGQVSLYRVRNGEADLLGTGQGKLKQEPWHVLRVQVVNSAHVDHPRLEIYLDGYEAKLPAVEPLQHGGRIGLITTGDMVAQFDRLHAMEMITSRPMSKPAAY